MLSAFIMGLAGHALAPEEIALLRRARPCGVILFARNVDTPEQVRRLTASVADTVGDEVLVLIDQEGGRVRRLRPPHWRALPPAAAGSHLRRRPMSISPTPGRLPGVPAAHDPSTHRGDR